MTLLIANMVSLTSVVVAGVLAYNNKDGWGVVSGGGDIAILHDQDHPLTTELRPMANAVSQSRLERYVRSSEVNI